MIGRRFANQLALGTLLSTTLVAALPAHVFGATTFVVNKIGNAADLNVGNGICDTSTNSGRQCTLRAAIQEANAVSGADTINFNITTTSKTIAPARQLPIITEAVTINGYSQSGTSQNTQSVGNDVVLKIVLDGVNAGAGATGLRILAEGATVRGLVIQRWDRAGISLDGSNNVIAGNFIGTNAAGDTARPNRVGILLDGSNHLIGGTASAARNLISGNLEDGIRGAGPFGGEIQGNYIGTTRTGNQKLANGFTGINITDGDKLNIGGSAAGAGNLISGNGREGIQLSNCILMAVLGNRIGTNAAGTGALGNTGRGIRVSGGAGIDIGGTVAGAPNTISANLMGVDMTADSSSIRGNRVGTKTDGTGNLGNSFSSVVVSGDDNAIGGAGAAGNVLANSKNEAGIFLSGGTGNLIQGNSIAGNATDGIYISFNADDNEIVGNSIAANGRHGILVNRTNSIAATGIKISGNVILANGGLAINLDSVSQNAAGVTANDSGDGDLGPNNQQNFPVLSSAVRMSNGITIVSASLNSVASTEFRIELFLANPDPSGHGEAQAFLATQNITTNSSGNQSFNFAVAGLAPGMQLSATAIRVPTGDTSEFSSNVVVVNAP
jgi:CSLREA domain-containing protein